MASSYFNISPTGGTDNGTVIVTPLSVNNTHNDRISTVTITNGGIVRTINCNQWAIPSLTGTKVISAPATGATYQLSVKTHYPIQFRYKPDWVDIDDGQGTYIASGDTIQPNVANGKTYNFTVKPNSTNDSRNTTNFGLYFYQGSTLQNSFDEVSITQPQGAADYITVPSSIALDWNSTNAKTIPVTANVGWRAELSNTTDFTLAGGQGIVTVRANTTNATTERKVTNLSIISTKASFPYTATCVVTQFREPTITVIDGFDVPPTGGTKSVRVTSDYSWWIQPTVEPDAAANIPYITMADKISGQNMAPTNAGAFALTWDAHPYGITRRDDLYVGYLLTDNSTTARSTTYVEYEQETEVSQDIQLEPTRIPESVSSYVSSGGGSYTVQLTTSRAWQLNSSPMFCTVSPTAGTGSAVISITVPANSEDRARNENLYFATTSAPIADNHVSVFQEAAYIPSISISPSALTFDWWQNSGTTEDILVLARPAGIPWDYRATHNLEDFEFEKWGNQYFRVALKRTQNTGTGTRYVDLTFSADSVTTSGRVTQYHKPSIYSPPGQDLIVPASGGTRELYVSSEYEWWLITNFDTTGQTPEVHAELNGTPVDIFNNINHQAPTGQSYNIVFSQNNETTLRPINGYGYFEIRYLDRSGNTRTDGENISGWRQSGYTTPVEADYISITPTAATITSAGTPSVTASFAVSANTDWIISSKPAWIGFVTSPLMGSPITAGTSGVTTIYPSATTNTGTSDRETYVYFAAGYATGRTRVTQRGAVQPAQNYVVVDPDYVELPSGRTLGLDFSVSADTAWTASTQQDWILISRTATAGTAGYTEDLTYSVLQNDTNAVRNGAITVTGGTASDTISIRQAASIVVADSIVVTPTGKTCSSGSSLYNAVSATASSNWTLVKPSWVRWIDSSTFNDTTGGTAGTTKLYINIEANSGSSRTGTTTFTCGTASTTYTVTQAEAYTPPTPTGYLELDPAQISPASSSYQIYEVEVFNNTEHNYNVVYGADWVKFYDGPYPSTADEVTVIEWGERLTIWLEVQAGHHGTGTIIFANEDNPSDYVSFIVNQQ